MSGQIQPGHTRYLGIINGIVYRIDSTAGSAGTSFGLVRLEIEPPPASDDLAPAQAAAIAEHPSAADEKATPSTAPSAATLFPRDGAEPLRAGHPDLWALLVAGTCLEGSTFRSV